MVVTSFVAIGVGPRTLGRQHAYSIALGAAVPLQVISVLLGPISRLLILLGNAVTPDVDFATVRLPPKSSCVRSWTWRSSVVWWPTRSAG